MTHQIPWVIIINWMSEARLRERNIFIIVINW